MQNSSIEMCAALSAVLMMIAVAASGCVAPNAPERQHISITAPMAPSNMKAALEAGTIAGYVAWEPYASDAVVSQKGVILYTSHDIWPNHPCCVLAVTDSFAAQSPDAVTRFVRAHIEATKWIVGALANRSSSNYSVLLGIAREFTGIGAEAINSSFGIVNYSVSLNASFRSDLVEFTDDLVSFNITFQQKITDRSYANSTDFIGRFVLSEYYENAANSSYNTTNTPISIRVGHLSGDLHQIAYAVAKNATAGGGISMFDKYNITVTDPTSGAGYASGPVVMSKFQAGELDIGYLGAPPAITGHLNGAISVKIISPVNSEGSAIIVKNGTAHLRDLIGKSVAVPSVGSMQYFLLRMIADEEGVDCW